MFMKDEYYRLHLNLGAQLQRQEQVKPNATITNGSCEDKVKQLDAFSRYCIECFRRVLKFETVRDGVLQEIENPRIGLKNHL